MRDAVVGITIGDPAGIGPEIVLKALSKPKLYEVCKPIVVGDLETLRYVMLNLKLDIKLESIGDPRKTSGKYGKIDVVDLRNVDLNKLKIGEISEETGRASVEYIESAVKLALNKGLDGVVTAPINKESIRLSGCKYVGHTELIAALTGVKEPVTMFWVHDIAIFFLTRHLSLKKALKIIDKEGIVSLTLKAESFLRQIDIKKPRIAVAALNPHASDGGIMGEEEKLEIIPAVKKARAIGVDVVGPVSADAVFHQAFSGKYDAVISLYHDQGHIAAKTFDFQGTVSVTLGLPFIRTSVDHGTAFDIAGKGIADSRSLEEAIRVAAILTEKMRK